jgi:predicted unusual protein kinase regulating ubiquinone biosynthesis (AarF/ABC1/UbiB family)
MPHINIRDLGRIREIGGVLVRHGFGHLLQGLPLEINERDQESKLPLPVRARQVLIELGPTFVKLGQVLSVRPDILPADFIRAFESLQDKVPPASRPNSVANSVSVFSRSQRSRSRVRASLRCTRPC